MHSNPSSYLRSSPISQTIEDIHAEMDKHTSILKNIKSDDSFDVLGPNDRGTVLVFLQKRWEILGIRIRNLIMKNENDILAEESVLIHTGLLMIR